MLKGKHLTEVESKGFVKSVRPSFRALAKGGKHREGEEVINLENLQRSMENILGSKTKI